MHLVKDDNEIVPLTAERLDELNAISAEILALLSKHRCSVSEGLCAMAITVVSTLLSVPNPTLQKRLTSTYLSQIELFIGRRLP